jgi:hypothetical protein
MQRQVPCSIRELLTRNTIKVASCGTDIALISNKAMATDLLEMASCDGRGLELGNSALFRHAFIDV